MTLALAALQAPLAWAGPTQGSSPATSSSARARVTYNAYILGPGDSLQIELLDIPELSGVFTIGPDGTLYLPRLRSLYVEGLSVPELSWFLAEQFRSFVREPQVFVNPVVYRPIRVYVGGEVARPGYYTLTGEQVLPESASGYTQRQKPTEVVEINPLVAPQLSSRPLQLPTVFDALRAAGGVTPYSNLVEVTVTRRQPLSSGGSKVRANLDFLSLITQGDESQNIRLLDGDTVVVPKSTVVLRDQFLRAAETNLSPYQFEVFVSGRVKSPGPLVMPQGSSLNQALVAAGGVQLLRGKVEFVRFARNGDMDRRQFAYNPNAPSDAPSNPILMTGDIIRVQDSALSASIGVFNELTGPFVGIYSVYGLFR
ncbi:polysaccharide biosynthesis/export family protein [Cyanobium sp. Alchichica 3B3-8F6]|uniref:polysaccharide biosynthesis/export family protein n=1 Tax=Cyanobium sp. Alchichica 3B3-8F6 TaxID=2823696 RepID=UPI0020CE1DD5|nr:polysaccharide biosynthesis/export family protein [Cyanobium sp. Alchichica 3B3-8F6]